MQGCKVLYCAVQGVQLWGMRGFYLFLFLSLIHGSIIITYQRGFFLYTNKAKSNRVVFCVVSNHFRVHPQGKILLRGCFPRGYGVILLCH